MLQKLKASSQRLQQLEHGPSRTPGGYERNERIPQDVTVRPSAAEVADRVEACIRLGQRVKRGEITAVRCGITGKRCTGCHGVPCLGSTQWVETGRQ